MYLISVEAGEMLRSERYVFQGLQLFIDGVTLLMQRHDGIPLSQCTNTVYIG